MPDGHSQAGWMKRHLLQASAFLIVAAGSFAHGGKARAAAEYRTAEIVGKVYYWPTASTKWRQAALGDVLPEGTLVQVWPDSRARWSSGNAADRTGVAGRTMEIVISSPMILRLGPDSLRQVKVSESYSDHATALKGAANLTPPSLLSEWRDAWVRKTLLGFKRVEQALLAPNEGIKDGGARR